MQILLGFFREKLIICINKTERKISNDFLCVVIVSHDHFIIAKMVIIALNYVVLLHGSIIIASKFFSLVAHVPHE